MKNSGWTWIYNSKVDHYFINGKSLCGKWMLFCACYEETTNNPCKKCLAKLKKLKKKEQEK